MKLKNSVWWGVLSKVIGIVVFLILVVIVNILTAYISNPLFSSVVGFLNANVLLIILISALLIIGEVFLALHFPFDLPGPLFNAVGSIFVVSFILNLVVFVIGLLTSENISAPFRLLSYFLYPLVFIIVVVLGYVRIFSSLDRKKSRKKSD